MRLDARFATTQVDLLAGLQSERTGELESSWRRFFELYYPAMVAYARMFCQAADAEDIAQKVLVKLSGILRTGRYEKREGVSFRAYLKRLIKNEFIDWRRFEDARGAGRKVPLSENSLVFNDTAPDVIDREWRLAIREAAVNHVLSATAMPDNMRRAYRAYVIEGRSPDDVAKSLGVSRNYVLLAKSRISSRIAAVESLYGD